MNGGLITNELAEDFLSKYLTDDFELINAFVILSATNTLQDIGLVFHQLSTNIESEVIVTKEAFVELLLRGAKTYIYE